MGQLRLLLLLALQLCYGNAEILTPPYFNLAAGKGITATATCGVGTPGPELYCQLVGAISDQEANVNNQTIIQGQQCDYCDPEDDEKRHPPEYANDGRETWWQSPPLSRGRKYEQVNLTISLGQVFHVAYVYMRMGNAPRPRLWVLEKSKDFGQTWTPWMYFGESNNDCQTFFGIEANTQVTRDDSVVCRTEYSKIVPLEGGEIPISILNNRPSSNYYFNSTLLQEWTKATDVRFRFIKTNNFLGHLMSDGQLIRQDPTVTRRYFYSVKDIEIGGRCFCNGHADKCGTLDASRPTQLFCQCQHNTCGPQCEQCCPHFEQKKWRQSTYSKKFACEPCNCFGHSDDCEYDPEIDEKHLSLDIHGNYEGGGKCKNCRHNTEGINCNSCKPKFFRPVNKPLNATDVCQPCNCNNFNLTGNCFDSSGQCECKPEYAAPNCDECSYGHFGYPNCRPCECNLNRTEGYHCEAIEGQCPCKVNFAGHYCDICAEEYYNFPDCLPCECNSVGALNNVCDVVSGNCSCRNNYGGRQCDICEDGYYDYPECRYCDCDTSGTEPGVCDKQNGKCLCKEGYGGPRCDQCIDGYYGYPNCEPCNCSTTGSSSTGCDAGGKCHCLFNFVGKTCNQCAPGYYNYPDCIPCNCDISGSNGISCGPDGKCQCRENFDGDRCDKCKDNYYNFPVCEGCNCDPAGIAGTFRGCGSLPAGELCQCKERVEGRICNECKKLFWNLQANNPDGCEDCQCHIPGVIGSIGECDGKTGQCICKPGVTSRDCSICADGMYNLREDNLFGCSGCDCNIGGSLSPICNKLSGQCLCRSRVDGQTCDRPMRAHYFPTLHQFQYEAEDGHTPNNRSARYGFAEDLFPGYSWKGYAVFSLLQNEIIHEIDVEKSSLYRMVLRYVNKNPEPIIGFVTITPDNHADVVQHFKVQFKPTNKPAFVTVAGAQGNLPSVMVMNPGHWTVSIAIEKNLLLDYFVLLPSEYYEASILTQDVSTPCHIGDRGLCRHYGYPNLTPFDTVLASNSFTDESKNTPVEFFDDEDALREWGLNRLPIINDNQPKLYFDVPISKPGPYVLVITYVTPPKERTRTATIIVDADQNRGKATLYPCTYTSVCRQVVTEINGKVAGMNFPNNNVKVVLDGEPGSKVAVESIVAIPASEWSVDYLSPKSKCVRNNGNCIRGQFPEAPDAKRIDLDQVSNVVGSIPTTPSGIYDNSSKFIYLDDKDQVIDVPAKVPHPGDYVFVVQYYQPDYPEFNVEVLLQNGKFYEAKVPMAHCPSNSACRSLVHQNNGDPRFQLVDNFQITLKETTGRGIWLQYILVIPAELYTDDILQKLQFDQTKKFIEHCSQNHFTIDTHETGFCRDSVFSLTTNYNSGALPCSCDVEGSLSFECDKFGGQCGCKPNVIGRRCNICKTGYFGFPNCRPCNCPSVALCDPDNGACICPNNVIGEKCDQCAIGTYGYDPILGCEKCDCNYYGVLNGDLQCDLLLGTCKCKENVDGRNCDHCHPGHYAFPYCYKCDCDVRGTTNDICDQGSSDCLCKENVQGSACDVCKEGMFNLQANNEKGCSQCFCFGKTTRCNSATLYRSHVIDMDGWDVALVNEKNDTVKIIKNIPQKLNETHIMIDMNSNDPSEVSDQDILYISAPLSYLNKKITSYGGWLNYTVFYVTGGIYGQAMPGVDVILQGADNFLMYRAEEQPPSSESFPASVQLVESNFETKHNVMATREEFMVLLKDLRGIYIRASYWNPTLKVYLSQVTLDAATDQYILNAELASSVEHCQCPPNYKGLSCEECAKGYYRVEGPFGGSCVKCECNGHADSCDVNTGICIDCKNGTLGEHCEFCQEGYYGNATYGTPTDCLICACPLPIPSNNFAKGCDVSDDGSRISCDCLPGYYGARCESCAAGFFGRPDVIGDTCKPCECSGNIDTNSVESCDSVSGDCLKCLNNTYGEACNLCAPGFFGDAIDRKNCQSCSCDTCGMKRCDSYSGTCECHENVIGESCDRCAPDHYGFQSCQGCRPCNCALASESSQCADDYGNCKCKPGVEGRTCDQCMAGFWNYTSEGCISCGCTTGYSRGASCNPTNGQCECLPGVLGEKCDHCPERTILDERRGCQTCDKCTHDLLDVTDELRRQLDPVAHSFQNLADTYFTNQRLDFINKTLTNLAPEVRLLDPRRIDFQPLKDQIGKLSNKAYGLKKKVEFQSDDSGQWKEKAEKNLKDVNDQEQGVNREINLVNTIINEVQSLATNTESSSGPKVDNALAEANDILAKMRQVSFTEQRDRATDHVDQANILVSEMISYEEPVKKLEHDTEAVKNRTRELSNQIDDMYNLTVQADDKANEAERLNFENKKIVDSNTKNAINAAYDQTKDDVAKSDDLNKKSEELYNEALYNFSELKNNVEIDKPTETIEHLTNTIAENNVSLSEVKYEVYNAVRFAHDLDEESRRQESELEGTRTLPAVRASAAYQDIVDRVDEARRNAESAMKSADNATNMADGLGDRSVSTERKSSELLNGAMNAVVRTVRDLKPTLESAKNNDVNYIANENSNNVQKLDAIDKSLSTLSVESSSMIMKEADNNADKAEFTIGEALSSHLTGNEEKIPEDLKRTKQLSKDTADANRDVSQANHQLGQIGSTLPEITNRLRALSDRQQSINGSGNSLYDKIELLKRKIENARDLANRIKFGLTFFPNTTLQLKNPESLPLQTTSSRISLYFRTRQANGFLMYLGNENRTNIPRINTHDFMALTIEGGYPVLTLDLGSGPQRIIGNRQVSDNIWRQLIVERTGRNVKLIVREDEGDSGEQTYVTEQSMPGSHSVFNLDKEKSKLFVGGIPPSFQVQDAVMSSSFDGDMEELMIGEIPLSFFNFVYGENNGQPAWERDRLVDLHPVTGYRFEKDGYALLRKTQHQLPFDQRKFRVQFMFKTRSSDGLMFLMGGAKHFLSLGMKEGHVLYQFELEDGSVAIKSADKYNDGEWHAVEALRQDTVGVLKIDGVAVGQNATQGRAVLLQSSDYLYFGGFPHPVPIVYKSVEDLGFEGCIDNAVIQEVPVDLTKNWKAIGVVGKCPPKFDSLVSFSSVRPGYMKWNDISMPQAMQLSLKFRTQSNNGLIYHLTNEDNSPVSTLSLENGRLVLDSLGERLQANTPDIRFNDGDWHYITATHNNSLLRLDIDDLEEASIDNAPYPREVRNGGLYVGNVPDDVKQGRRFDPFEGCIGDATLNGMIINFANATEKVYANSGQCPESSNFVFPDEELAPTNPPLSPDEWPDVTDNIIDNPNLDVRFKEDNEGRPPPLHEDDNEPPVTTTTTTEATTTTTWPTSPKEPETVDGCRLPHWPATDPDQFSENAWRFGTQVDSRIEYSSLGGRTLNDFDFQIDLKTLANDGIVFYSFNPNEQDMIAVYLKDGYVRFDFICGGGTPGSIVSERRINDHQWHTVVFRRTDSIGELVVDEMQAVRGQCQGATTNVMPPFFVGGVDPALSDYVQSTIGSNISYSGCVRNFMLNGINVPEGRSMGVIPCSKRVEPGMFFYPGNGSNWFEASERYTVGRQIDIQMDIKPRSSSGILLSVHGRSDHVVLEMVNGTIKFLVKAAKGQMETSFQPASPNALCDGNWHNIRAVKQKNAVVVSVDHITAAPGIGTKNVGGVISKHPIYIGGHPHLESGKSLRGSVSRAQYVGCINNIIIKEKPYPLDPRHIHGKVIADVCPTI